MKTLRSKLTRPVCLVLALLVMAGSMAAAALTGSPYDVLKDAAFSALTAESGTYWLSAQMYLDGELYENVEEQYSQFSPDANLNRTIRHADGYLYESYQRGNLRVSSHIPDENLWRANWNSYSYSGDPMLSEYTRGDAYVRLFELGLDLLVGDLKNNLGMTQADGIRTVSATLTAQQIPELYNAALTVGLASNTGYRTNYNRETLSLTDTEERYRETYINNNEKVTTEWLRTFVKQYYDPETGENISDDDPRASEEHCWINYSKEDVISETRVPATKADYGDDKLQLPMEKGVIDYVSGTARIDKDGYPVDADGTVRVLLTTIFGDEIEVEVVLNIRCENINSTVPQSSVVDADGVLTEELFQSLFGEAVTDDMIKYYSSSSFYGRYYGEIIFSLNEDGTVNRDSIQTMDQYSALHVDDLPDVVDGSLPHAVYETRTVVNGHVVNVDQFIQE